MEEKNEAVVTNTQPEESKVQEAPAPQIEVEVTPPQTFKS